MEVAPVQRSAEQMAQLLTAAVAAQQQLLTRQLTANIEAHAGAARSISENLGNNVDVRL